MASLVIFHQLLSVSKSKIPPKNVWSVHNLIPISLCTNTSVSVADRPALKQNFMATLCSFSPSIQTGFTRQVITRTLSEINKRNSVRERMSVDST
jgi:hypothetical protein